MNIKRGIDRIAIVIAIIAALFGFYVGSNTYDKKHTTRIEVFTNNFRSYIKEHYLVGINEIISTEGYLSEDKIRSILLKGNPKLVFTIMKEIANDPDFQQLSFEEQRKAFIELDSDFGELPIEEQAKGIKELTSPAPVPSSDEQELAALKMKLPEGFVLDTENNQATPVPFDPKKKTELTQKFKKMKASQEDIDLYFKHDPVVRYRLDYRLQVERRAPDLWEVKWRHPLLGAKLIIGLVSATFSFGIVFFGIQVLYELVNWIVGGFKERK